MDHLHMYIKVTFFFLPMTSNNLSVAQIVICIKSRIIINKPVSWGNIRIVLSRDLFCIPRGFSLEAYELG
jgi:hypothetical protein